MKSCEVKMEVFNYSLDILVVKFYIRSTGNESFEMGNSSFVWIYDDGLLTNPELIYSNDAYSGNPLYEDIEYLNLHPDWISMLQWRTKPNGFGTEGNVVSSDWELLCRVNYDINGQDISSINWRLQDTAIVTPTYETIQTNFFINGTLNLTVMGSEGGNTAMDIGKMNTDLNVAEIHLGVADVSIDAAKTLINEIRTELNSGGGGGGDPVITFGNPVRHPTNDGVMLASSGNVLNLYTSLETDRADGKVRMWYHGWGVNLSCLSDTGDPATWFTRNVEVAGGNPKQKYAPITAQKFKGFYYMSVGGYVNQGKELTHLYKSTDGINWVEYLPSVPIWKGEDRSLAVINQAGIELLVMPIRPHLANINHNDGLRHSGIMISDDGINWIDKGLVFVSQGVNRQYYSHSLCQVAENLFYSVVNVFNESTQKVTMELYKFSDIYDINTYELLKSVDPLQGFNQNYGGVSYDKNKKVINLLVAESKGLHNNSNGNYFRIALYTVKVEGV